MNDLYLQKIAETWIKLYYLPEDSSERDQHFWAYNKLSDLCQNEPEICWRIIHIIRRVDGSEKILANLAAGPLEDLLVNHGVDFIDNVEKLAQSDQQFRKMLGSVWQSGISESTWRRIKAVASKSW